MFCILTDEMNIPGGELIRHLEGRKNVLDSFPWRQKYPLVIYIHVKTLVFINDVSLISSVQSLSRVPVSATPWTSVHQASLSITDSQSLLTLMSIKLVISHPTISSSVIPFSSCLLSFPASGSFPMSPMTVVVVV